MDSEKCRVFLTVVEEGSLSRAADVLDYTVSGVSRNITALEEECGLQLLYRDRKGVQLTSEGETLLPVFREYAKVSDKLTDMIRSLKGLHTGKVSIGVVYVNYFRWVTRVMHTFQKEYPEIEVRIVQGNSTELIAALQEHKLDFVIASKRPGPFRYIPVQEIAMCVCMPMFHPLAGEDAYPLKRLETDPLVAPYSDSETDYAIALKEYNIHPHMVHVTNDIYSAYSMVEAGLGVSLLNRLEPECWNGKVVLLPTDPPITVEIGIMVPEEGVGPSANRFLQALCREMQPISVSDMPETGSSG